MSTSELQDTLSNLLASPENEIVEFKEAKHSYDFNKLGCYFSALSNEANLQKQSSAWLVFGVNNKRQIVGSQYRTNRSDLDKLKGEIAHKITNGITFVEIYEYFSQTKRILLFQIPAAPQGFPVAFEGHYYGRNGEELSPLNIEEIERIRRQAIKEDWSLVIVQKATIDDLDTIAIEVAKKAFVGRFSEYSTIIKEWDNVTFLNKAKITIRGGITRAALILLGRSESEHLINPSVAKLRWVLKDKEGNTSDGNIFEMPLILAVDKLFVKIRNLTYRYLPLRTLFPEEMPQYDPFTIREAINNCIAHQDYRMGGMVNVIELENELIFSNLGTFLPESVKKVVLENTPQEDYQNPFLANAMFNLKMIETRGEGIRKMFLNQRKRFFPMPEYQFEQNRRVKLSIIGKVIDVEFAKVVANHPEMSLERILLLDQVQKKKPITDQEAKLLRQEKLIEGRKPNYFISEKIAKTNETLKAQYIKQKSFDDKHFKKMILQYLQKFGSATRQDIERLIGDKLSTVLSPKTKYNKISNLLGDLKKQNLIKNIGVRQQSKWVLSNASSS